MGHIATDWRQAGLGPADQALCAYAEKLTQRMDQMAEDDIVTLRNQGFDDRAVHDATQIIGYFNYINRVAEALSVEPEDFIRPWESAVNRQRPIPDPRSPIPDPRSLIPDP